MCSYMLMPLSRFNSRTRKGCDFNNAKIQPRYIVSIHAPVKGATERQQGEKNGIQSFNSRTRKGCDHRRRRRNRQRRVSIHAPVKGATSSVYKLSRGPSFNSRTRKGCDSAVIPSSGTCSSVSIHAPVKGATPLRH